MLDKTSPVITLNCADLMSVDLGMSFTDPGATAWNGSSGLSAPTVYVSGSVDKAVTGSYILIYTGPGLCQRGKRDAHGGRGG